MLLPFTGGETWALSKLLKTHAHSHGPGAGVHFGRVAQGWGASFPLLCTQGLFPDALQDTPTRSELSCLVFNYLPSPSCELVEGRALALWSKSKYPVLLDVQQRLWALYYIMAEQLTEATIGKHYRARLFSWEKLRLSSSSHLAFLWTLCSLLLTSPSPCPSDPGYPEQDLLPLQLQ